MMDMSNILHKTFFFLELDIIVNYMAYIIYLFEIWIVSNNLFGVQYIGTIRVYNKMSASRGVATKRFRIDIAYFFY